MKSMYQCEKCGKLFDSWNGANDCEDSHLDLDFNSMWNELRDRTKYAEGGVLPSEFVVRAEYNQKFVNGEYVDPSELPVYGLYVLKRVLSNTESVKLNAARLELKEKERLESEEFDRRWKERKEREAAEKAARELEEAAAQEAATQAIQINEETPAV